MKKKLKKTKQQEKTHRKKKSRADIRYLGFVVNPNELPPLALTHALVNLKQAPCTWYVIELDAGRYPQRSHDCVGRYFRTIFFLSVQAHFYSRSQKKLEKDTIILGSDNPDYARIPLDIRDWDRDDKIKSVSPDFPMLRMAIHGSLFWPSGDKTRGPLRIIWKGKPTPKTIFFWTKQRLQSAGFNAKEDAPFRTVRVRKLAPETERLPLLNLMSLASALVSCDRTYPRQTLRSKPVPIVSSDRGYSWQNTYRKALISNMWSKGFFGIAPSLSSPEAADQQTTRPASYASLHRYLKPKPYLIEFLEEHKKVLVTCCRVIADVTIFRYLAWLLALVEYPIGDKQVLPLYVSLRSYGIWPEEMGIMPCLSKYIAFYVCHTIRQNLSISDMQEFALFTEQKRQKQPRLSRDDMLERTEKEVGDFLSDKSNDLSNIVFLLEGDSKLFEYAYDYGGGAVSSLLRRMNKVWISTSADQPRVEFSKQGFEAFLYKRIKYFSFHTEFEFKK